MKKLYLLPFFALAIFLVIRNAGGVQKHSVLHSPLSPPTTIITPPRNSVDSFQVQMSANGNPVFITLSTIADPSNGGNPKVWVNGSPVYISSGTKYRINPTASAQTTTVRVKYNSSTQPYFDQVTSTARGPGNFSTASFEGLYTNNAPNNDQALVTICDSVLCP